MPGAKEKIHFPEMTLSPDGLNLTQKLTRGYLAAHRLNARKERKGAIRMIRRNALNYMEREAPRQPIGNLPGTNLGRMKKVSEVLMRRGQRGDGWKQEIDYERKGSQTKEPFINGQNKKKKKPKRGTALRERTLRVLNPERQRSPLT